MRAILTLSLLSAAAAWGAEAPVALPVANAGFEEGLQRWSLMPAASYASLDTEVKRGGAASVRLRCDEPGKAPWVAQSVPGVRGGARYALKAWCRGAKGSKAAAALKIEFYNDAGENTSGHYSERVTPGEEWREISIEAAAGPDTTRASILLRLFGAGEVWFDDATFVQTGEAPIATVDPLRAAVVSGSRQRLEVRVRLRDPWQSPPAQAEVTLSGADGKGIPGASAALAPEDGQRIKAALSLPALAPGDYLLKLAVPNGAAECRLSVTPAERRPRNLTDDGSILSGGKPFFPIGVYHVSPGEYALLAEHGFNCVQGSHSADLDAFGATLDTAEKAGIRVDVPFYAGGRVAKNLPVSLETIRRFRSHPAVLNWKIIDEPDLRPDVVDEVADAYRKLREADPDHPLLLTIASPSSFGYWAHFCDILQIDPYPIPSQPLTMVSDYCDKAKAVLQPWQNLTAVLQCGWIAGPPSNQPTYEQARSMVYLALIRGAKGIFWYSMHDPGWDLSKTPLWLRFKELNEETAQLGAIVLSGKPVEGLACDRKEVLAAAWQSAGKRHILATNPGKEAVSCTLKLPGGAGGVRVLRGEGKAEARAGAIAVDLSATGSLLLEVSAQ